MKNNKKGFTLVELLVVIAILAILASVAVVGYTAFVDKANESNAKTEAHQIDRSIEAALLNNDAVLVKAGLYVVKGDDGYVTATEIDEDAKFEDLSADFTGFALSDDNGVLVYENNGYIVNVDTNKATKAQ